MRRISLDWAHFTLQTIVLALTTQLPRAVADDIVAGPPKLVALRGYDDHAMEPCITRDGRYLLFNNLNQSPTNTDIHFAERIDDFNWAYRGKVAGINTAELEGVPAVDDSGTFYFVSPRSYASTLSTVYSGKFQGGAVSDVRLVESISIKKPGIVNFDVEVSRDGKTLFSVDSVFKAESGPQTADLFIATWDGAKFARRPNGAELMKNVNRAGALQYAATISDNQLTLYFTRFDRSSKFAGPQIYVAKRKSVDAPFDPPMRLKGLGDFVEATAFSSDEQLLYFHRKDGEKHRLYAVHTPRL